MPYWLKFALVAVLLLLAGTLPLAMPPDTGSLEGIISDEIGPIAGAKIESLHIARGEYAQTRSGPGGFYRLEPLRRGSHSLWITADGHESVGIPKVIVESGATTRRDVSLKAAGRRPTGSESLLPY